MEQLSFIRDMIEQSSIQRSAVAGRTIVWLALLLVFAGGWGSARAQEPDKFKLEFKYDSRSSADSTRKDYYDPTYQGATLISVASPAAYDKTFLSTVNDLNLGLKWTFGDTHFFDVKETLHYQTYRPEDFVAYALDSYKYKYLDHLLNVTYGVAFGEADLFQLDYYNNIYRIPIENIWDYLSNMGKARFNHQINRYTSLGMGGSYEERQYTNDKAHDYQEGALVIDLNNFLPERVRYDPVSNSTRGDKSTFERFPTGMEQRQTMDYYTTWTRKPGEDDPRAKFMSRVTRGDLYLSLLGDFRTRKRTSLDNGYFQPSGTFKAKYDVLENVTADFEDVLYQRKHQKESETNFLFDHASNKATLMITYEYDPRFTYYYTFSDEFYQYSTHKEQDYRIDSLIFETYYKCGHSAASLLLKEALTRHGTPRTFYNDSDQFQAIFGYDYPVTRTFLLHLKDEWIDSDYKEFQDLVYSSFTRNTWRVALEKVLSKSQKLEIGYQSRREWHEIFDSQNQIEKSLFFSWLSHF